jgi:hypothetical protein
MGQIDWMRRVGSRHCRQRSAPGIPGMRQLKEAKDALKPRCGTAAGRCARELSHAATAVEERTALAEARSKLSGQPPEGRILAAVPHELRSAQLDHGLVARAELLRPVSRGPSTGFVATSMQAR